MPSEGKKFAFRVSRLARHRPLKNSSRLQIFVRLFQCAVGSVSGERVDQEGSRETSETPMKQAHPSANAELNADKPKKFVAPKHVTGKSQ